MDLQTILYCLPGVILGLTVHEFSHAFCAYKLGDNTARDQGRLTLNPVKHIDLIGLLFIIFARFGWAKPVEFNPENLRNYRRDKAKIAASGPLSNLVLGILLCFLLRFVLTLVANNILSPSVFILHLLIVLRVAASINFGLFVFNLLPIPPLDGSHIVFSGLNLSYDTEVKIRKLGLPLLFLALIAQNHFDIPIIPIRIVSETLIGLFL